MRRNRKFAGSRVVKRSVRIGAHKTSLTAEEEFWQAIKEIAFAQQLPISKFLAEIDGSRKSANFSSAVRLLVLDHYRRLAEAKR